MKTAEGAMQEVQDMLNRMVYLAAQSANGAYDNEVDRANLQKEVDQLKSEINRISDFANFNGIKLLDGTQEIRTSYNLSNMSSTDLNIVADGQLGQEAQANDRASQWNVVLSCSDASTNQAEQIAVVVRQEPVAAGNNRMYAQVEFALTTDLVKEGGVDYTKNNILVQSAQAMLA